jgi:hypothetical protein
MAISFIPAIDDAVHIAIPEWYSTGNTVELRFSAVLGDEEFQQFKLGEMKVQLWSDIPVHQRREGEWGELDFHEISAEDSLLSVVCSVPLPPSSNHFSFTYRLVFSSGQVKWLGAFGRNGRIHIDNASKNDSGIVFEQGWETPSEWSTYGKQVDDVQIAQVVRPEEWSFWTVGKDGFFGTFEENASLLFLVPHTRPYAICCPKTLVLRASADISISVTAAGKISISGSGSLLLNIHDPSGAADSFADIPLLGTFGDCIGLASTRSTSPFIQTAVLPLISSGFQSRIAVASASLDSVLASSPFTIFSPTPPLPPNVQFLDSDPSSDVSFSVPPFGGLFILSPLYSIQNDITFSVLSPHLFVEAVDDTVLPTPPPSPHLLPIAHLTSSYLLNRSSTSISELGDVPEISSPTFDDAQAQQDPSEMGSTTEQVSEIGSPTAQVSEIGSPTERAEQASLARSTNVVATLVRNVSYVLMLWLSFVLFKLVGRSTTTTTTSSSSGDSSETEETPSPVDVPTEEIPSPVDVPTEEIVDVPTPVIQPLESSPPPLHFTLLDAKQGPHSLVFRDTTGSLTERNISDKIVIEVNGRPMSLNHVKLLFEGAVYLDIDWDQPGRMVIKSSSL